MNGNTRAKGCFGIFVALAVICVGGIKPAHAEKCETPERIRFSLIPAGDVERDARLYRPLFKRIEELTGRPVKVVWPSSYASVAEGLQGGTIDIATIGPAGYVEAKRGDARLTPFATIDKREGHFQARGPYYHAMLVVLSGGPYSDIHTLKDARLALTDPGSTSGSLLPRDQFTPTLGMPLEAYFGAVSFSGSHAKSLLALARGDVDAAFIASTQLEEAHLAGKLPANKVRVLWKSKPIPYDPFVYRGQLCEPMKRQIRAAFLGETAATSLRDLLEGFKAVGFIPIEDSHYSGIRKVLTKMPK